MLFSALAYLLTFFVGTKILPGITLVIRLILTLLLSRTYGIITNKKSAIDMVRHSVSLAHPIGFLASILHGYWAISFGAIIFAWLTVSTDLFLGIFIIVSFLLKDIPKLLVQSKDKKEPKKESKIGELTILEEPIAEYPVQGFEDYAQAGTNNLQEDIQKHFKNQYQEFMHGNSLIGLIGRITGAILGTIHFIGL